MIKAREKKIAGISFDIPNFVEIIKKKDEITPISKLEDSTHGRSRNGKIIVEIDAEVLDSAVY